MNDGKVLQAFVEFPQLFYDNLDILRKCFLYQGEKRFYHRVTQGGISYFFKSHWMHVILIQKRHSCTYNLQIILICANYIILYSWLSRIFTREPRKNVSPIVVYTCDVNHLEIVSQCSFLKTKKPQVMAILQAANSKYVQERFAVSDQNQVWRTQCEVFCFFKSPCYRQALIFYRGVHALLFTIKFVPSKYKFLLYCATLWSGAAALAVFLHK